MGDLKFFDCNCGMGPSRKNRVGLIKSKEELLQELDWQGIEQALVYHISAEEYYPAIGNQRIIQEASDEKRFLPCWVVMPHHSGEMAPPDQLIEQMLANKVHAVRMNAPSTNRYSVAPWGSGELLKSLESHGIPLFLSGSDLGRYLDETGQGFTSEVVYDICKTYPNLPVIILRLNFQVTRVIAALAEACPNLYVDISYYSVHMGMEFLCSHIGADHILFGSGLPIAASGSAVMLVESADIGKRERQLIAGDNLRRLLSEVKK
jgi:predicted TIM-barrel fold metal-dependent hydrolase